MSETVRLSVNITAENAKHIKDMAAEQGTNVTAMVAKAIALERFFTDQIRKGAEIQLKQLDGTLERIILR